MMRSGEAVLMVDPEGIELLDQWVDVGAEENQENHESGASDEDVQVVF
jgi:hypothetical protein